MVMLAGTFIMLSGTIGIVRFPYFFSKVHAASMTDSFGAPLTILGCALKFGISMTSLKVILIIPILWITSSVGSYLLCKSRLNQDKHDSQ
ncbi:monovalent cation/proton antiporter, MnhG/PhaG subunit [Neorickettsia helminthoeca str. Oregon]|uniref:Monovalent cation/proton antiporter, MnhG/PhaG subunit n=2 Tax=Neorickettsia helminthoeca TaxID=33994 RepID=X5H3A3_9RICK|nr:monovalent cation/proton antiporter, MnhG/PhaG subunit [Neorickettsia helminthoeca str. Oregon]